MSDFQDNRTQNYIGSTIFTKIRVDKNIAVFLSEFERENDAATRYYALKIAKITIKNRFSQFPPENKQQKVEKHTNCTTPS